MGIELFNEDCMSVMSRYPDKHFDLACVDPPYGIGVTKMDIGSRKNVVSDKSKKWDVNIPAKEYFAELRRVSREQIIWGGNYFPLPPSRCWLVWDKGETIYGRGFAEAELAWTSLDAVVRMFKLNPTNNERIHPTQKPVMLYQWILVNYSKPGQRVLDTHLGSGSSAIAAHYFGVDFVGCEIDEDYFVSMKKRFYRDTAQISMFDYSEIE